MADQNEDVSVSEFREMEYKMKMLGLEVGTFEEVFGEVDKLERWHVGNLVEKNDLAMGISRVESKADHGYGLLGQKSKEQKLTELHNRYRALEKDLLVGEELLRLVYAYVWEKEVWTVRSLKRFRLEEILGELSRRRLKKIQGELLFWKAIVKLRLPKELWDPEKEGRQNKGPVEGNRA